VGKNLGNPEIVRWAMSSAGSEEFALPSDANAAIGYQR
jgi:hypothetical protein